MKNNYYGICAAAILHNTKTDTYHPILYTDSPMPGANYHIGSPERVKSKGHHTDGFSTLEAAKAHFENDKRFEGIIFELDNIGEWDGEGIPADIAFVDKDKLIWI